MGQNVMYLKISVNFCFIFFRGHIERGREKLFRETIQGVVQIRY